MFDFLQRAYDILADSFSVSICNISAATGFLSYSVYHMQRGLGTPDLTHHERLQAYILAALLLRLGIESADVGCSTFYRYLNKQRVPNLCPPRVRPLFTTCNRFTDVGAIISLAFLHELPADQPWFPTNKQVWLSTLWASISAHGASRILGYLYPPVRALPAKPKPGPMFEPDPEVGGLPAWHGQRTLRFHPQLPTIAEEDEEAGLGSPPADELTPLAPRRQFTGSYYG